MLNDAVIAILQTVLLREGTGILTDIKRCSALLQDYSLGQHVREVRLLVVALEEGIASELHALPNSLPPVLLGTRLLQRLIDERCLDRTAAAWAVRAWGVALGVSITFPSPTTQSPIAGNVKIAPSSPQDPRRPAVLPDLELVQIPSGNFTYGEQFERKYLPAYEIMKYPVTVAQYRQFCVDTSRSMPSAPNWGWQDNHPIVNVSWDEAAAFAAWAGLALPTEEEWEKAARGTDGRRYPWGDQWDAAKCSYSIGLYVGQTTPVRQYPAGASPYGVMDMAGSVWEWCDSWYEVNNTRVLRGGSWDVVSRTAPAPPSGAGTLLLYGCDGFGFRCVLRSPGQ